MLNERQVLGKRGMQNYAEKTSREGKFERSYFRIWSNEWLNFEVDVFIAILLYGAGTSY